MRPSWIEIDLDAIRHNVASIAGAIAPASLCAVVKADGYGHGDVPVAEAAVAGGARRLAVALVEEGVRLREAGIDTPILLLSEPPVDDAGEVVAWGLTPTVYREDFVGALEAVGPGPVPVHVKVDTGMHRGGADLGAALGLLEIIDSTSGVEYEGLWTHFAVSEEDEDFTRTQVVRFDAFVGRAERAGFRPGLIHAANTAGAIIYPEARYDMARIGLGIYGLRPAPHIGPDLDLRPAMRVVSKISMLRRVAKGERVSYGRRRAMPADGTLATVPIGYADSVFRRLSSEGGQVLIGGVRHSLAGTVTMDQIVIDVGDTSVAVGDEVVLLGRQGDEEIGADEWAERLDTINYEIVCSFSPRLPRRYRRGP